MRFRVRLSCIGAHGSYYVVGCSTAVLQRFYKQQMVVLPFTGAYLYSHAHARCCTKKLIKLNPFLVKFAYFSPKV